jgi:hypothetical protein
MKFSLQGTHICLYHVIIQPHEKQQNVKQQCVSLLFVSSCQDLIHICVGIPWNIWESVATPKQSVKQIIEARKFDAFPKTVRHCTQCIRILELNTLPSTHIYTVLFLWRYTWYGVPAPSLVVVHTYAEIKQCHYEVYRKVPRLLLLN